MAKKIKEIGINDLFFDVQNARYGGEVVENQREAITKMFQIKDMDKKIYNLATHIATHGLDPSELPLALPFKPEIGGPSKYLVPEGNRRILAIKLLHNPNLSPLNSYARKFAVLSTAKVKRSMSTVQCSVLSDRKTADLWVDIKHTGQNDGVGRVDWDGRATDAHRERTGKQKSTGRQVLDYIAADKSFSSQIRSKIDQIDITNLTRLFQGSPAKIAFGLVQKNGVLHSAVPLDELRRVIEFVADQMLDNDFNVKQIYHKEDQEKFIKDKIPKDILPVDESFLGKDKTWQISNLDAKILTKEQKKGTHPRVINKSVQSKRQSQDRMFLIDFSLRISSRRINQIYGELKRQLKVHDTPNAVSVLFRVFLELSCDWYIRKGPLKRKDNGKLVASGDSLKVKVENIAHDLQEKNFLDREQATVIRKVASSDDEIVSVDSLNKYIHSSALSPNPKDLNRLMDNWAPLFQAIWK